MTKTPWLIRKIFKQLVWKIPVKEKTLYLTFDDGPHEVATPFALDQLKKFNAHATFFCLGKNVAAHPDIYRRIIDEGHVTGNHSFQHLNGWKQSDKKYFEDILEARKYIDSVLFRPPYGKITPFQVWQLRKSPFEFNIIMWDVLSKDYDVNVSAETCAFNVLGNVTPGSIVVFHDSQKAFPRMQKALVATLEYFSERGWKFQALDREAMNLARDNKMEV